MMSWSMVLEGADIEERFLAALGMTEAQNQIQKNQSKDWPLHGRGDEFADVDFHAWAQGFGYRLQERTGDFGADIVFAAVVANLRGDFAHDECGPVSLQSNGCQAGASFAEFADDTFHGFLFSKPGCQCAGSGSYTVIMIISCSVVADTT